MEKYPYTLIRKIICCEAGLKFFYHVPNRKQYSIIAVAILVKYIFHSEIFREKSTISVNEPAVYTLNLKKNQESFYSLYNVSTFIIAIISGFNDKNEVIPGRMLIRNRLTISQFFPI